MKRLIYTMMVFMLITVFNIPTDAQYKIVNYTDMNQINSLTEDGDYIWVCTSGGAFKRKKSDGSLVKVFNIENSGINRNAVESLYIDIHGNYWFGLYNGGISKFDGTNWTTIDHINGEILNTISIITADLNGNLWFGGQGKVYKFDGSTWTTYVLEGWWFVESIVPDDEGNIWFGIAVKSFWKLSNDGILTRIAGPGDIFINNKGIYSLLKDNFGSLWIGYGGGIYKYKPSTDTWQDYGGVIGSSIYSITQDNKGRIWFGTSNGVYKYDGNTFTQYLSGRTYGSRIDMALDVLSDAQGNVWIGGYVGFAKIDETTNKWTTPIMLNCLPDNYVETLVFDSNKKAWVFGQFVDCFKFDGTYWNVVKNNSGSFYTTWVQHSTIDNSNNKWLATMMGAGSNQLGLVKIDNAGNHTTHVISGVLSFQWAQEFIQEIKFDAYSGKIYIATQQGIFWYKPSNNTFGQYKKSNSAIAGDTIQGLACNGSKIWYSTFNRGIGYLDQSNNTWTKYTTVNGLPSKSAGEMAFDKSNNLWFVSSGLTKWNGTTFQTWYPPINYSSHVACDNNGNVWIGGGKLAKFNNGIFTVYSTDNGLLENSVSDIVVDPDNNVWVGTGQYGLSKLVPQAPVANFSSNRACLPSATTFSNKSLKTDTLTRYEWDIYNNGTIDFTTRDASFTFPAKGLYNVRLKVMNDNLFSEKINQVLVLESPSLSLNPQGNKSICFGESQLVKVVINNTDPLLYYQIAWNNGISGIQQNTALPGKYTATVNNGECETVSPELNLSVSHPYSDEKVCMVSVDKETGKNLIVWERSPDVGIESYNIYKLFGNTYVPIGNVSALETSEYVDYNSTPDALAARYAISAIDTCGNESVKSSYHQTIHLGASAGIQPNTVVLDWTNYIDESKIWQPAWYYIYRGTEPTKLVLADSTSSAFTEWNDMNPGTNRYYQILIKKTDPCVPKEFNDKKAKGGPYVHSLSNLEDNRLQGIGIEDRMFNGSISIFPNPFKTEALIKWVNPDGENYTLTIYDLKGTVIRKEAGLNSEEYLLQRERLASGCYVLELKGSSIYRGRLLVD